MLPLAQLACSSGYDRGPRAQPGHGVGIDRMRQRGRPHPTDGPGPGLKRLLLHRQFRRQRTGPVRHHRERERLHAALPQRSGRYRV